MTNALALILVINAHIVVGQSGPDLPDDFGRSGKPAVVETLPTETPAAAPEPSIVFSSVASSSQLVKTPGKRVVTERWLVSEDWCQNCPAAKARFKAAGNDESHIITISEAMRRHNQKVSSVPWEYTWTTTVDVTYTQPPSYRKQWPPKWDCEGDKMPSKSKLVKHLRDAIKHKGKHWQEWHIESWTVEQLAALHDDDHESRVPRFDQPREVEATISNAPPSVDTVAAALAMHLLKDTPDPPVFCGLFDVNVQVPESFLQISSALLIRQEYKIESAGVSMSWKGGDRGLKIRKDGISIQPGVTVTLQRGPLTVWSTLQGVTYDESLQWVKLELANAPDLTVRFTP